MKQVKNESGFAVVEAVLAALLVAAIGAAGYFAFQDHHKNTASTTSTSTTSKHVAAASVDPTAGWKTYTSSEEPSLSFKYPSSWTLTPSNGEGGDTGTTDNADGASITSPSGTKINWMSEAGGFGGGCDQPSPVTLTAVSPLTNASGLYYVAFKESDGTGVGVIDQANNNNTTPTVGENVANCMYYPLFNSHADSNRQLMLGTLQQAVVPSDLATAKLILESAKY